MIADPQDPFNPENLDPALNETGRVNMGDVEALKENHPGLFLPKTAGLNPPKKSPEEIAKMVEDLKKGVSWHLDEEKTEQESKHMWFPRLFIPGLSEKFGESRPHKEFFPNERNVFATAFLNDCAVYLFGVEAFVEHHTETGIAFIPNEKFVRLPVFITPTAPSTVTDKPLPSSDEEVASNPGTSR